MRFEFSRQNHTSFDSSKRPPVLKVLYEYVDYENICHLELESPEGWFLARKFKKSGDFSTKMLQIPRFVPADRRYENGHCS